ncbi:MAG: hypothetical protein IPG99_16450 [Ignavibacteria bacterium]|nr:hypothetical protein [Ignavibacteria bacterium]
MKKEKVLDLLASLTGRLHAFNEDEEKRISELQEAVASAIEQQDPTGIRSREFQFEKAS